MPNQIRKWRRLTDEKWLNLHEVSFVDPAGREKHWTLASRHRKPKCVTGDFAVPDAVVIAPYHGPENKMVVTREFRAALADFEYGFPAGLVDPGESPQEAAFRELEEETGLAATRLVHVGPAVYSSAGMTDESVCMVYVECAGRPSTAGTEGSEQIEVFLVDQKEAARLCDDPGVKFDAKAWLVLNVFGRTGSPWSFFRPA